MSKPTVSNWGNRERSILYIDGDGCSLAVSFDQDGECGQCGRYGVVVGGLCDECWRVKNGPGELHIGNAHLDRNEPFFCVNREAGPDHG